MNGRTRPRNMRGLSLIEVMVALAIGLLLVLGLVEVFSASRTAYQLSTGLARNQENARFAIDILQRDVRATGHMGCVNDQARFLPENVTPSRPALFSAFLTEAQQFDGNYAAAPAALRFDRSIEAYEATDTESGKSVVLTTAPTAATGAGDWAGMPADLFTALAGGTVGHPVHGSDVLVLRYFAPTGAQVTSFTPGNPASVTFESDQADRLVEGLADPGLFAIADCMQAAVFNATSFSSTGGTLTIGTASPENRSDFSAVPPFVTGQAMLYRAESVVYYIGVNAQGNPALYRLRYNASPSGTLGSSKEELVEGVESMQLQFGQDSRVAASDRPTGNIGASAVANALASAPLPTGVPDMDTAWRRVGLVQIGLLSRSTEPAAAAQRDVSAPKLAPLGVQMTPPADSYYRAVYEDTIALRNRLFGN